MKKKELHIQLQEAEAKWNKSVSELRKVQAVVSRHYNVVKKLREEIDSEMAKSILAKTKPVLTEKQWAFILQGDGTQMMHRAQEHVLYKLLGLFRGGMWAYDDNKQVQLMLTQGVDIDLFSRSASIVCKHYKPMLSMFDVNNGTANPKPSHPMCFYFGIHDKDSCMHGVYYLEVTLDGKRARVLSMTYSRLSVYFDTLPLKEQVKQVREKLQSKY